MVPQRPRPQHRLPLVLDSGPSAEVCSTQGPRSFVFARGTSAGRSSTGSPAGSWRAACGCQRAPSDGSSDAAVALTCELHVKLVLRPEQLDVLRAVGREVLDGPRPHDRVLVLRHRQQQDSVLSEAHVCA